MRLILFLILATLLLDAPAVAREGYSLAVGGMAFTNSTKQGGQGSAGSTLLTETNATYHGGMWGAGVYFQFDKQGSSQTDTAVGPRLELTFDPFYIDLGYAVMMNRSFTDRAIKEQTGSGLTLGVGARFALGTSSFLQFTYRYRTQSITKQDGVTLDEPISQLDAYPLFGIGTGF